MIALLSDRYVAGVMEELIRLHADVDGAGRDEITFRTWTPHSARKTRRRLFVESRVGDEPRYVAKVPADPGDFMVEREWSVLSTLRGLDDLRPAPVRRLDSGFVMTYVPCRDFPDAMSEAGRSSWPHLLGDALELTAKLGGLPGGASGATAREVAATYVPDLGAVPERVLAHLDRALIGPTHGDLGPWNVRVDEHGRLALVDWEDYRPVGLPGLDVLNLVLTASLIAFPDYREKGFDWLYERVFHDKGDFWLAADHALTRYADLTNQDTEAIVRLTPIFCRWMIHRIRSQGRPTEQLFYGRFSERYEAEAPTWAGRSHV